MQDGPSAWPDEAPPGDGHTGNLQRPPGRCPPAFHPLLALKPEGCRLITFMAMIWEWIFMRRGRLDDAFILSFPMLCTTQHCLQQHYVEYQTPSTPSQGRSA